MKYLIIGHGRHGKDTVAEIIAINFGAKFAPTSQLATPFVRAYIEQHYDTSYISDAACFEDRVNNRPEWAEAIAYFCKDSKTALADLAYANSDIYVGVRMLDEFYAIVAKYKPLVIWVDACDVLPLESKLSMELTKDLASIEIDNNYTRSAASLGSLERQVVNILALRVPSKWNVRFNKLANEVASWSKDLHNQVGAVIVNLSNNRVVSLGYNGFPAYVQDAYAVLSDRTQKNNLMIHAEVNAVLNAVSPVEGCAIVITRVPCLECAKLLVQAGIVEVHCPVTSDNSPWAKSQQAALDLFKQANIQVFQELYK
jgi:dCMP deaminase